MSRFFASPVAARTHLLLSNERFIKSLKLESIDGILPAVLTWPERDRDGDIVVPSGGDWSKYPQDPVVNWDHDVPVGRGVISHHNVTIQGETHRIPIGNTKFFETANDLRGLSLNRFNAKGEVVGKYTARECLDAAEQAYGLVRDEIVSGVSMEFEPIEKNVIGKSLRLGRAAYEFVHYYGLGYAHTPSPVNGRAGLVAQEQRAEKALKALERGGSAMPLVIRKSLTAIAHPLTQRAKQFTTGVGAMARTKKAIEDDMDLGQDPVLTDAPMDDGSDEMGGESSPRPTEKALLDGAQSLLDVAAMLEQSSQSSEHKKGKKHLAKVIGTLQSEAEKMKIMAEKIKGELDDDMDGDEGEEPEEMEEESETEVESDDDEDKLQTDDEGMILSKSFRNYKPQRVTIAELKQVKGIKPGQVAISKEKLAYYRECEDFIAKTHLNK